MTTCGAPAAARNVKVVGGDGSWGYPDLAPYDAISVAAGAPEIPPGLLDNWAIPAAW